MSGSTATPPEVGRTFLFVQSGAADPLHYEVVFGQFMMTRVWIGGLCALLASSAVGLAQSSSDDPAEMFTHRVRPVLEEHCSACHKPDDAKNRHNFLKAEDVSDVETRRTLWRDVATQLHNRTMPPGEATLTEEDRLVVADWIKNRLESTGCVSGEYAGYVGPRRLNRREYRNTIRDLFGVELDIAALFSADESGGAGFDTNGATLYLPPLMIERYLEAAQTVVDRAVVSPPMNRVYLSHELTPQTPPTFVNGKPKRPVAPEEELSIQASILTEAPYALRVSVERPPLIPFTLKLKVDGVVVGELEYQVDSNGGATARSQTVNLSRGLHTVAVSNGDQPIDFYSLTITQDQEPPTPNQAALHYRLFGMEPGQAPLAPRRAAERLFADLLPKAYRRPVEPAEVDQILALYDRAAERGDPFEESVKYALKAVLMSPRFLFRTEEAPTGDGIEPLGQYEMASRLSYFLWSSMPDEELYRLAREEKLQRPDVLAAQVERMLDDPRSRSFAAAFMGQWLGTQEVGGRVVPLLTELQHFYTPDVAADLRQQPELLLHYILTADRSLLDILDAPYTFLTDRLVNYYQLEGRVEVGPNGFHLVSWPDDRRAGVLGLASVLAMTSHYKQPSPVLRGAWVLEKLLGTPVPPPPPDVPSLPEPKKGEELPVREMLAMHRDSPACSACHNLMDPIGLGLENFDWMGRWRDQHADGRPVDASGSLPTGETFDGPAELRALLLERKEDFARQLVSRTLGYAVGRGRQDGDQCTIEGILDKLEADGYRARTLIREVVLSAPFRSLQKDAEMITIQEPVSKTPKRLLGTK